MNSIHLLIKELSNSKLELPFSVYSAYQEQKIQNVPIVKPLLIVILNGLKQLGKTGEITCIPNSFIFLANSSSIDMRNIPNQEEYLALLIDFDYDDFNGMTKSHHNSKTYIKGEVDNILKNALLQFLDFSRIAPIALTKFRKREILEILYYSGYTDIFNMYRNIRLSDSVEKIVYENLKSNVSIEIIASKLFMSSSTLRRKLKSEGTDFQSIKNRVRLGHGLHLLQTTDTSIGNIADLCGYQSQSKFTENFKSLFGVTPRALRKTKMPDLG